MITMTTATMMPTAMTEQTTATAITQPSTPSSSSVATVLRAVVVVVVVFVDGSTGSVIVDAAAVATTTNVTPGYCCWITVFKLTVLKTEAQETFLNPLKDIFLRMPCVTSGIRLVTVYFGLFKLMDLDPDGDSCRFRFQSHLFLAIFLFMVPWYLG